jgi:hypothetical protein
MTGPLAEGNTGHVLSGTFTEHPVVYELPDRGMDELLTQTPKETGDGAASQALEMQQQILCLPEQSREHEECHVLGCYAVWLL